MGAVSLEEALKQVLADDNKISKFEAKVIRELVMADSVCTDQERALLIQALESNLLDVDAREILSKVVLKAHLD